MTTALAGSNRLIATGRDAALARDVLDTLDGPDGFLSVARASQEAVPLRPEVGMMLQQILEAVAQGRAISVTSLPAVLTTSSAAAILGISRATLMKLVKEGSIPAHKVGTHTRLLAADVLAVRKERRRLERAAFDELRELLDES